MLTKKGLARLILMIKKNKLLLMIKMKIEAQNYFKVSMIGLIEKMSIFIIIQMKTISSKLVIKMMRHHKLLRYHKVYLIIRNLNSLAI